MVELSKRLQAVANMVTEGRTVADVGCDHGFVSIYLIEQMRAERVIAMDVNVGPMQIAREHVAEHGLQDKIEVRLSDGVTALHQGEADSLVIAGMGGRLMVKILSDGIGIDGTDKIHELKELILQPQSEIWLVRQYLATIGFAIDKEDMVLEDGKYYMMMHAVPVEMTIFDKYGRYLLEHRHPVLQEYLLKYEKQYQSILSELSGDNEKTVRRKQEILKELAGIREALTYYEM